MDGRHPPNGTRDPCCRLARACGSCRCPRALVPRITRPIILLPTALALLLACAPSRAQDAGKAEQSIGPTLICDTPDQLNRFVELVNDGREAGAAVRLVNEEVRNPLACGNALAAFEVGKPVAEVKMLGELVSIVEVEVFALSDGSEWTQVHPTTQYTIRRHPGETL